MEQGHVEAFRPSPPAIWCLNELILTEPDDLSVDHVDEIRLGCFR